MSKFSHAQPPTIHEERQRRLTDVGENDAEGGGQLPLVLVPRELEHALPLLPPKVKAWWVQHVGEAEAVDSVRFAEMVFSDGAAGELVREVDALLGDIGDHRSSEPAAAPAPHGSGTSAMNGSSYGSRGTGPRSPFLAGYVIPHLTDWCVAQRPLLSTASMVAGAICQSRPPWPFPSRAGTRHWG